MPNHIKNKLEIIGSKEEVQKVKNFLKGKWEDTGEVNPIDFNNIIPQPESIKKVDMISGHLVDLVKELFKVPSKYESDNSNFGKMMNALTKQCREKAKQRGLSPEDTEKFVLACQAYKETGYVYWYDWCIDNWGTKWGAYQTEYVGDNIIMFDTAWSGVPELMIKVSQKFPKVKFVYKWSDEDTGYNCGVSQIQNGKAVTQTPKGGSKEAYDLAFELRPDYKEDYELKDGNYVYKEDEE